jgi:hypothetical protein
VGTNGESSHLLRFLIVMIALMKVEFVTLMAYSTAGSATFTCDDSW